MNTTVATENSLSLKHHDGRWNRIKSVAKDLFFIVQINLVLGAFIFWQASAYIPK